MTIFINIVLILISIVLIVAVLMQEGNKQGLGAIGGGAETFFGKSKAKSYEGKLVLITKIAAGVFIVLAIIATILNSSAAKKDEIAEADVTDGTEIVDVVEGEDETAEPAEEETAEGETEEPVAEEEAAEPVAEGETEEPAAEEPAAEEPAAEDEAAEPAEESTEG